MSNSSSSAVRTTPRARSAALIEVSVSRCAPVKAHAHCSPTPPAKVPTVKPPPKKKWSHAELIAELHVAREVVGRVAVMAEPDDVEFVEVRRSDDAEETQRRVDRRIRLALRAGKGARPLLTDATEVIGLDHRESRTGKAGQLGHELRDDALAGKQAANAGWNVELRRAAAPRLPVGRV